MLSNNGILLDGVLFPNLLNTPFTSCSLSNLDYFAATCSTI